MNQRLSAAVTHMSHCGLGSQALQICSNGVLQESIWGLGKVNFEYAIEKVFEDAGVKMLWYREARSGTEALS